MNKEIKATIRIAAAVATVWLMKKANDKYNSSKKNKKILIVSPENSEQAEKVLKIIEKLSKQKGFECNDCLPGYEYPCKREITITNNKKNSKISCWEYDKVVYDNDYKEGFKEFSIIIFVFDGDKYLEDIDSNDKNYSTTVKNYLYPIIKNNNTSSVIFSNLKNEISSNQRGRILNDFKGKEDDVKIHACAKAIKYTSSSNIENVIETNFINKFL